MAIASFKLYLFIYLPIIIYIASIHHFHFIRLFVQSVLFLFIRLFTHLASTYFPKWRIQTLCFNWNQYLLDLFPWIAICFATFLTRTYAQFEGFDDWASLYNSYHVNCKIVVYCVDDSHKHTHMHIHNHVLNDSVQCITKLLRRIVYWLVGGGDGMRHGCHQRTCCNKYLAALSLSMRSFHSLL